MGGMSYEYTSLAASESQKGVNAILRCSAENQKGAITIDFVQQ